MLVLDSAVQDYVQVYKAYIYHVKIIEAHIIRSQPFPLVSFGMWYSNERSLELLKFLSFSSGKVFFKYSFFSSEPTVVNTSHPQLRATDMAAWVRQEKIRG